MKTKKRKVTGGIVVSYEEAKAFVEQLEAEIEAKRSSEPTLVECALCGSVGCDLESHPGTDEEIWELDHVVPCDCCKTPICVGCEDYYGGCPRDERKNS